MLLLIEPIPGFQFFSTDRSSGDFHLTLLIEVNIFSGRYYYCRETVPSPDKAHLSQERMQRKNKLKAPLFLFKTRLHKLFPRFFLIPAFLYYKK